MTSIIRALEPTFGGFNLEDVAAPRCFSVMDQLDESLSVPIMHDDQFGTATAVLLAQNPVAVKHGSSPTFGE